MWKTLVAAAREQVLDQLAIRGERQLTISRQQGPHGAADIELVAQITNVSTPPQDRKPIETANVSLTASIQWIGTTLKAQCNLSTDSEYSKVAATCKDIERLLRALWERPDDIPMARENRVTLHIYLLILNTSLAADLGC